MGHIGRRHHALRKFTHAPDGMNKIRLNGYGKSSFRVHDVADISHLL